MAAYGKKAQDKVAKLELELESDRSDASARTTETVLASPALYSASSTAS